MTSSAIAYNDRNSSRITITLQKNGLFGWGNVDSTTLDTNGQQRVVFSGVNVSAGSNYRFLFKSDGDLANAMISVVLWS
ncbi:MAG: hypothetical protein PHP54_04300 [Clostridia bacterium]|nr:hypothetical protein [Clostridia bacterium]